eukprot:7047700-Prymnesium_polylepis.2
MKKCRRLDCNKAATRSTGTADTPCSRADDVTDKVRSRPAHSDSPLIVRRALPTGINIHVEHVRE